MRRRFSRNRPRQKVKVALFITCLIDSLYPNVGEAVVSLLRKLDVEVTFPEGQTCCGHLPYSSGYHSDAKEMAQNFIIQFEREGSIVVPSGSCAAMIKQHYKESLRDEPDLLERLEEIASRTYELTDFIVNVLGITDVRASHPGKVTYHESCHLLRDLGISSEPRALIENVEGVEFMEMENSRTCCGFGGMFSVENPEISMAILEDKLDTIKSTGAHTVVANDMGCLMHISGALSRIKSGVTVMHIAELLANRKG